MKKHKGVFYTLTKRPGNKGDKHKKENLEEETDEYYDEQYDDQDDEEEYYDEDDPEYEENEDEEYLESEEYEDDEQYEEEYEEETDDDSEYDDSEYDDSEYDDSDDEIYSGEVEYTDEEYSDEDEYTDRDFSDEDEEYGEYDDQDEYYDENEAYDDEYVDGPTAKAVLKPKKAKGFKEFSWKCRDFLKEMDFMDWVLVFTTTVLIAFIGLTIFAVSTNNKVDDQVEDIETIGQTLASVGIVGDEGLLAMEEAGTNGLLVGIEADTSATEVADAETDTDSSESKGTISVSFESVEKDIKIRFKNTATDSLITGTAFEVTLTNQSSGNTLTLTDDDMDGIIYKSGIKAGKFDAIITSTDKFRFPTTAQTITIKDKVEYVVINVEDEVKQEDEVEVAKEDTEVKVAETEETTTSTTTTTTLSDTVDYVASSQVANATTYTKIDKSKITDPSTTSSAKALSMKFDDFTFNLNSSSETIYVGQTTTLSTGLSDSDSDGTKVTYKTTWNSSNTDVATVDNGTVTGKAAGNAVITCTVVKTTVTTKTETETVLDYTNAISEESYNNLSDDEKSKYTEKSISDAGDDLPDILKALSDTKIYVPSKEVSVDVPSTTVEEATKTCTVKVKDAEIKSASFELTASSYSVAVGGTVTVSPSKIEYTMTDGSTKTYTSDFPTIVWTPTDISIASISSSGVVTGVKAGSTTIKATVYDTTTASGDSISTSATITVTGDLSLALDKTSEQTIKVGATTTITPTVTNYSSDSGVTWTSSNTKVATVSSSGVVTGVAVGSATITCTTNEKNSSGSQVTATCAVKVVNSASTDTTTKLKDNSGNQVYVKDSSGNYVEAVYADYYTASAFYIMDATTYTYYGWQTIDNKTYYYDKNGKYVTGTQVIQGVSYTFNSSGVLSTSADGGTRGIDVSKWNGTIDWSSVKASGIDYVIIRCGYRGSSSGALIEDPNFKTNIAGATAAGLKVGVYFFSQAIDEVEAVKEASFAISLVQGYKLTYPIFIDTEKSGGRGDSLSASTRTTVVSAFCQTIENSGYKAGIYASKTWFTSKLKVSNLTQYKIWVARYATTNDYTTSKYDMWQYTASGSVSGISGKVDLNYSYLGY